MAFEEVKLQPFNRNRDPVLTITMQAQARDGVAIIWGWGRCRGTDAVSSSRGSGQSSRGVTIHFINPVESVNFKENRARMNYLFMGFCTRGPRRSPFLSFTFN